MKSKHSNKILIPLVILIWVWVGANFLGWGEGDAIQQSISTEFQTHLTHAADDRETRTLQLNYRDPFLDKLPASSKTQNTSKTRRTPRLVKVEKRAPIRIPQLSYQGLVSGENTENKTAILRINKKTYTVRPGDSLEGISIQAISQNKMSISIADTLIHISP